MQDYNDSDNEDDTDSQEKYSKSSHNNNQNAAPHKNCCLQIIDVLYAVLEMPKGKTPIIGRIINFILFALIVISIVTFIISTEDYVINNFRASKALQGIELACSVIFIFEYLLRFIACTSSLGPYYKYGQVLGRIRYLFSFSSIIDIVSTVPTLIITAVELSKRRA